MRPSTIGQAVGTMVLVAAMAAPAAAEPVAGFGFAGVSEVNGALELFALDDGGFVVVGFEELQGIGPDGRDRWTVPVDGDWANIWASDGRLVYLQTNEVMLALDGATGARDTSFGEVAIDHAGHLLADPRGGVVL